MNIRKRRGRTTVRMHARSYRYECSNCAYGTDNKDDIDVIEDVQMRVAIGELMPPGQCPECGSLIELPDDDIPEDVLIGIVAAAMRRWGLADEDE